MARDLHDILGHSPDRHHRQGRAGRAALDVDPERARAEIADLERLSRDALADVRARRRRVPRGHPARRAGRRTRRRCAAAGIEADLPGSADDVPSRLRELFAWTVREGVTNVVRHSGAHACTVRLDGRARSRSLDDGAGAPAGGGPAPDHGGHGLAGLRERADGRRARPCVTGQPWSRTGFALRGS